MFKKYLITLLSFFAFVLIASRTVSAQEIQNTGYDSAIKRLAPVEAQLVSARANTVKSTGGCCQSCGTASGCRCGGGWSADAEILFLRYHESDGVDEIDYGDKEPVDGFGFDPAWRVTLGHTDCRGLSYRFRYFSYDQNATVDGGNYSVSTYNLDFEVAQEVQIGRLVDVEFSGGVRYNNFEHDDTGDSDNAGVDQQFDGIGLIVGLSADRCLGCGDLYGRVRHAILVGDDEDPTGSETIYSDSIHSQLELGVGYKIDYCMGPAVAELRLGVEMQNWYTYEDQEEEVGFAGFLVGLGLNY